MIERSIKSTKLEKMRKYPDKVFRLLWVADISTIPGKNFYKVIFKDINSNMYLTENIFPEFLHDHFAIGLHYKDTALVDDIKPIGEVFPVTFRSTNKNRTCPVSDVLTDDEYNLSHSFYREGSHVDYTEYCKRQPCVIFEDDKSMLIFPCAVIGARYYFTSSAMRRQIFFGNLEGLYEYAKVDLETRKAAIHLKSNANEYDAPYIVRFATNKFSLKRWNTVFNGMLQRHSEAMSSGEKNEFVPLELDFPVQQVINMEVRGLAFDDTARLKKKILVFDILEEDSAFGFDNLEIQRRARKLSSKATDVIRPTRTYKTIDLVINKPPSSQLQPVIIGSLQEERNTNLESIIITRTSLPETNDENTAEGDAHTAEEVLGEVPMSVIEDPNAENEKLARKASVEKRKREDAKDGDTLKEYFHLENFTELTNYLGDTEGVQRLEILRNMLVPVRRGRKHTNRLTWRESYKKNSLWSMRCYRCAMFNYKGRNVCLVEVDHRNLPNGPGTYVLVSSDDINILVQYAKDLMQKYVDCIHLKKMIKEFDEKNVKLKSKRHPSKKGPEYYVRWCKDLLKWVSGSVK
jgi:hypothetical protein